MEVLSYEALECLKRNVPQLLTMSGGSQIWGSSHAYMVLKSSGFLDSSDVVVYTVFGIK